jgi:hypothetical protein
MDWDVQEREKSCSSVESTIEFESERLFDNDDGALAAQLSSLYETVKDGDDDDDADEEGDESCQNYREILCSLWRIKLSIARRMWTLLWAH